MRVSGSTHRLVVVFVAVLIAGLGSGCSDTPTSATYSPGPWSGMGPIPGTGVVATGPLASSVIAAMDRAIQDEFHAEQIYSRVLEDFGEVLPFANVVFAETRHSESIARVYMNHEMAVPESSWNRDNVPRFRIDPGGLRGRRSGGAEERLDVRRVSTDGSPVRRRESDDHERPRSRATSPRFDSVRARNATGRRSSKSSFEVRSRRPTSDLLERALRPDPHQG